MIVDGTAEHPEEDEDGTYSTEMKAFGSTVVWLSSLSKKYVCRIQRQEAWQALKNQFA